MSKKIIDGSELHYTKIFNEMVKLGLPLLSETEDKPELNDVPCCEEIAELARLKFLLNRGIEEIDGTESFHVFGRKAFSAEYICGGKKVDFSYFAPLTIGLKSIAISSYKFKQYVMESFEEKFRLASRVIKPDWECGEAWNCEV